MAQLNMHEREIVSQLWAAGHSRKAIAERLGRSRSTISRELKRNGAADGSYSAVTAQEQAMRRRRQRPLIRKLEHPELNAAVRSRLSREWSPDQIAGRLKKDHPDDSALHVAPQTIYTWVEQDENCEHWQRFFRRGGRPPKPPRTGQIPRQVRIDGRPEAANRRERLGDFEGDTIVSRGKRSGLVTLVDRRSRYLLAAKLKDRTAARTRRKMERLLKNLAPELRQTITFDNGKEFSEHEALARHLGISVYFAHPYASWERGTSENTNRLLRQYYPKGTDFAEVSHYDLASTVESINQRPRKCLGYQTPSEVFFGKSSSQRCD
jgi:transposase, IS30 family